MPPKRQKTRSQKNTLAQAPFDDARADLILHSSDEVPVHFHVSASILSVASTVFADMFHIPLPASQQPHEIQVVSLTEDSETLDLCLRHIYPVQSPNVEDLRQMRMLAEFARKYQADVLEQYVIRYLTDAIKRDPVGVYLAAVKYGYKAVGVEAAHSSLNLPIFRLESPNLQDAPAELYVELLRYHAACGEAASDVAFQRSWFPKNLSSTSLMTTDPRSFCSQCRRPDFICGQYGRDWSSAIPNPGLTCYLSTSRVTRDRPRCLWNYLQRSALILSRHPTADAVTAEDFVLGEIDCEHCSSKTPLYMLGFRKVFGTEIKKAVEQVSSFRSAAAAARLALCNYNLQVPLPEALRSLS